MSRREAGGGILSWSNLDGFVNEALVPRREGSWSKGEVRGNRKREGKKKGRMFYAWWVSMAMQETVICTISSQTRLATSDLPFFPSFASYQAAETAASPTGTSLRKPHTQLSFLTLLTEVQLHQRHSFLLISKPFVSFPQLGRTDNPLVRLSNLKSSLSLSTGALSLVFFLWSTTINWYSIRTFCVCYH